MVDQTQISAAHVTSEKISFEDFLRLPEDLRAELVNGELVLLMPPSIRHQFLASFLNMLVSTYLSYRPSGVIIQAPSAMKLPGEAHGREPDLMFVGTAHADRVKLNYVEAPADIVVEIVSPESDERDRVTKYEEYQAADVPEYWLIDAAQQKATMYQLGADKHYHAAAATADGALPSAVITGFRLPTALLWQETLPNPLQILEIVQAMIGANE